MFHLILDRVKSLNTKNVLTVGLLLCSILYLLMPIIAYQTVRDPVVGGVMASCIFGMILNLATMIGNVCDNYYMVYLYFVLTVVHVLFNISISISFLIFNLLVLTQIVLAIVALCHTRILKAKYFNADNKGQYGLPTSIATES